MKKRHVLIGLAPLAAGLVVGLALTSGASGAGTTTTFAPSADAYVNSAHPNKNYGRSTTLRVDASPTKRSYLEFNLAGLSGNVTKATLRLYATSTQSAGYDVHAVGGSWSETGITYADAPPFGAEIGSSGPVTAGTWTSVDVTSAVTTGGVLSLGLSTSSPDVLGLSSREGAHPPQLVVATTSTHPNINFPARGAFYYSWYPETWTLNGRDPHFTPTLGHYDSSSQSIVDQHIQWLDAAKVDVGIASWWGQGTHNESTRIPLLLNRTQALASNLKWTVYYEDEGQGDPSVSQIQADLAYLKSNYASSPSWAYADGKPVIFVYGGGSDACGMADRWHQAAPDWYVVLKVFAGYKSCANQPDSWHQYSPAVAEDHQSGYSFSISPGFWMADETTTRLARDPARFQKNVADMVASGEPWQLVTTFNDWGDGTGFENATEYGSTYLDILAGGTAPPVTHTLSVSKTGTGSGTVASSPSGINCGSTCSASFNDGTSVTLTETPASGSTFTGWSGDCSGTSSTCTVAMSADRSVTASFSNSPPVTHTLSVSKTGTGSGTVTSSPSGINCGSTCSASFTSGTSVTLTETPASGSTFTGWSGDCSGTSSTCTVAMSADRSVTADFASGVTTGPCGSRAGQTSTITKVMWIIMENHDYSSIYGPAPYETTLANECGLATNYHAISHPSLPNYVALTSGGTQGITDDSDPSSHPLNVNSIFHEAYPSARSYEESMGTNCKLSSSGQYAVRHNPWAYYVNGSVGNQRDECNAKDVPTPNPAYGSGNLLTDVLAGTLPGFSFVTPGLCNDMHDCSVATGDAYLAALVPAILAGPDYTSGHLAVVITYDENSGASGNQVYTAVISPFTAAGTKSSTNYTHYSLLRSTEEILGVPLLGGAASASDMRAAFGW